jgi:flagella basal body P-ring formation protein FlgA
MTMLAALLLSGVTVVLPMEAPARGTELTLGAIADVRGDDPLAVERVRAYELGSTPAPGFTRLLHAHQLREELARALPGVVVTLAGEPACRVKPVVVEVSGADLMAAAVAEIERMFAGEDVSFEPRQPITQLSVPAGAVPPTFRVRLEGALPDSGILAVPIQILVDGTPYRTLWTSWSVARWETLPVLARPLQSGESIQLSHLVSRRVEAGAARGKALPPGMLVGAVAARDLSAGTPVTALDVHRPAVVGLGDNVLLEVRKGAIAARVAAVALGTAAIGDRVRVRSSASGEEHSAVVVSRDLVRITLGG